MALNGGVRPYKPVGCLECRKHRLPRPRRPLRAADDERAARGCIQPLPDATALRQQAMRDGLRPLRLAGVMKVAEGVTTLEEVLRCTPAWE